MHFWKKNVWTKISISNFNNTICKKETTTYKHTKILIVLYVRCIGLWVTFNSYSYLFCVIVTNTRTKSNFRKKGIISSYKLLSITEAETHSEHKPGGSSWCRVNWRVLLSSWFPMACYNLLIEPRTNKPRIALPTVHGTLGHQVLIKKMPYRFARRPYWYWHFLNYYSLFQDMSMLTNK